ncbi:MAG TPA: IclR family transcriptional regulator [Solirubrobacteraceae bacterium]|nr:IclR family transcriptional regulator [Solirubrobacteraceae bacterium]
MSENGSVGTLARGLDVLELFATSAPELSQKEISDLLGLPMPTVHRLTALLTERGWLDRDPTTRRLRLGLELARLVPALMTGMRLPELARPYLLRLASDVQETVNVAILQGPDIVYLLSESGDRLLTSNVMVGMRLPAHCTALGKCLLAQLPEDVARAALGDEPYERRTERTQTTFKQLAPDLAAIRDTGVSVSDEEYEVGLVSIAVPVRWIDGPGTGAINVSLPSTRATPAFRDELTRGLLSAGREIDRQMGAPAGRR